VCCWLREKKIEVATLKKLMQNASFEIEFLPYLFFDEFYIFKMLVNTLTKHIFL